jgi:hypothetical protein
MQVSVVPLTVRWFLSEIPWGSNIKRLCNGEYRHGQIHTIQSSSPRNRWCQCTCTIYNTGWGYSFIERRILPGMMVVDNFLHCLFWRMVHKSYTLFFCLEEWLILLLMHAYHYKIMLRFVHHFSFHSCYSIMCCAKLRNEIETQRTKRNEILRNATKYTNMRNEAKIY